MKKRGLKNLLVGGLIVVVGLLYLLFNLGILPGAWRGIILSWKSLLILLGVIGMYRHHYVSGLILMGIGVYFLLPQLSIVMDFYYSGFIMRSVLWPVLIIAFGILIMSHRHHFHENYKIHSRTSSTEGKIDYNLVMNGVDEVFLEPVFRGGEINAILGGAKLDLRRTTLPEGDTVLKISSICGGVTLLIPWDWNVIVHNDTILGGFADHRHGNGVYVDRRLIIETSFILGGGSIE